MAGQKLSPRQKMIGMMYLVLTALLALNISKDVLKAFSKINGSLYKTNTNFSEKNNEPYNHLLLLLILIFYLYFQSSTHSL